MRKKYLNYFILTLTIVLAVLTRSYKIGNVPSGLYLDEAGQGYSAYSILLTGKDEFGKPYPFIFRAFTDFKPPIYTYLIVPLIPIFGLTVFTVRFPSLVFSVLTIPILFLLINKLTNNKTLANISVILLAISPWHILFGRTAYECNIALFFLISGILLFYFGLKKPLMLIFSAISFALAFQSYHAQRLITPFMTLILFIKYRQVIFTKSYRKYVIISFIVGMIILIPSLTVSFTPGFLARATGLNIFSVKEKTPSGTINEGIGNLKPILNNRLLLTTKEFASLYTSYISPRYMFQLGDYGPRSSYPELATFFVWQAPFYIYGLYKLIKSKRLGELKFLILSLLFISPIPAAITRDPYSSIRALQMVIPQTIIITFGILNVWILIKNHIFKYTALLLFAVIVLYSLTKLYSSVIILNEFYRAKEWDYGWNQLAQTLKSLDPQKTVVVDTARHGPYIELLFFLKYDPRIYVEDNFEINQNEYYSNMNKRDNWKLGNIIIRPINWTPDTKVDQYLVGDALAISDDQLIKNKLKVIKDIYYPDGSLAFRIVETTPK